MTASIEDVETEMQIQEDIQLAEIVFQKIKRKLNLNTMINPEILFALCLIYARMLRNKDGN